MKNLVQLIENIDYFMKNPKAIMAFFRKHVFTFLLAILVFTLLYIYIAESARRKALQKESKISKRYILRLEKEIKTTKKDFYNLQTQIKANDSLFYNRDFDLYMDVNSLLNKMSNRFEQDGVSNF
jgi:uncharacterized protein YlxW (UPF0749 family)